MDDGKAYCGGGEGLWAMVTKLKIPNLDAKIRIMMLIRSGEVLIKRFDYIKHLAPGAAVEDQEQLLEEAQNWHEINLTVLGQMFDTDQYAKKYELEATYHPPVYIAGGHRPQLPKAGYASLLGPDHYEPPASLLFPPKLPQEALLRAGLKTLRSVLAVLPHLEERLSTIDAYINARRKLDDMNISERDRTRFQFLKVLYEVVNGNQNALVDMWDIAQRIGIDREEAINVYGYLKSEGLLGPGALGGDTSISHKGILEIEQAERAPQQSTEHFTPQIINNLHVHGDVYNSPIQQGNQGSTQSVNISPQAVPELNSWLKRMEELVPTLDNVDSDAKRAIIRNVSAVQAELGDTNPDPDVLKKGLERIRSFGWAVAEHAGAQKLLEALPAIIIAVEQWKHVHP